MINNLKKLLKEKTIIRYIVIGGTSYAIELAVLLILAKLLHISPVLSVGVSFWVGLITSFFLQKFFAFNNKTLKAKHLLWQSVMYGALVLVNYLFTLWFVGLFNPVVGLVVSRTIALIITTFWNYFIYKYVLFPTANSPSLVTFSWSKLVQEKRKMLIVGNLILGIFITGYIALGIFSRPMADDLIFLSGYGLSDSVANFNYVYTVNGRFTSLTIYLLGFTIPFISEITALITMIILGGGLYLLLREVLADRIPPEISRLAIIFTTFALLSAFAILTPSPPSSIFWFSAAVVHVWSYGFILMLIAYLLKLRKNFGKPTYQKRHTALYSLAALLIGLFGEIPALTIIFFHIFVLALDAIRKTKKYIQSTVAGLFGGIAAFGWLYFAPASVSRRQGVEAHGGLTTIDFIRNLPRELHHNISEQLPVLFQNIYVLIPVFFIGLLFGLYLVRSRFFKRQEVILYTVIAGFLAAFHIANFSLTYIAGGYIPLRIYASSSLALILSAYLLGFVVGNLMKTSRDLYQGAAFGSIVTLLILSIIHTSAYVPWGISLGREMHSHAKAWDARDAYIKEQIRRGNCHIIAPSLPIGDVGDINKDPNYWINKEGMEDYYRPPTNRNYWQSCTVTSDR